ncbi:PepSY-associated TM helix domain-containing protein [Shewanella algae]|uniref:PepSY-associated TM helix domain-containing protein n=1 Tax=Shewanella algae TaxID=38313 RepID=UPI00271C2DE1|nr:PepSY-associated TM helix domain-containing protein [Shewanella algae]MDO8255927.1 PepSY-associated TM helix domain-containing protein [Shewanella algae]
MRRFLWKWHGLLGLIVAMPLFIIALSGSLLVFKAELDAWLSPEQVLASADSRLGFGQLLKHADQALPEHEILGWEFAANGEADSLYVAKMGSYEWQKLWLDPATGQLLSPPMSMTHMLTDWLLELHYTLLLDHAGLLLSALVSVLLILLGLSGIVLHRHFWRTLFTLRFGRGLRLLLSDGHKMLGILGVPVFLILGFTGAWWNIEHFIDEEFGGHDDSQFVLTKRYYNAELDFDAMLAATQEALPGFVATYVRLPDPSYPGVHFFGHQNNKGPLRSRFGSIISFDDQTGKLSSSFDVRTAGTLYQFVDSFRPLHYGTFGGLTTRILWCLLGFLPCLMALSGFWMWRSRVRGRKRTARR